MKIGIYQFSPEWGSVNNNLKRIKARLSQSNDVDLWMLPELCTTGYQFTSKEEIAGLSEEFPGGRTAAEMTEFTAQQNIALILGVAERSGSVCYNSAAVFDRGKYAGIYRKVHLFDEEKMWFEAGNRTPEIFDIKGVKVGVMVCFDWIFPETARTLALKGAQLIAHCANLVLPFCQEAMVTRSIENRVFTATANRIGKEARSVTELTFTGMSQVTDPVGKRVARLSKNREETLIVTIDPERARDKNITPRNNLFEDRKPELYEVSG